MQVLQRLNPENVELTDNTATMNVIFKSYLQIKLTFPVHLCWSFSTSVTCTRRRSRYYFYSIYLYPTFLTYFDISRRVTPNSPIGP
jgi:hypothetical protein